MTDDNNKKKEPENLEVCTQAPEWAEHARPNEAPEGACDDGRAGTKAQQKKEATAVTGDKDQDSEDRVKDRKEERQETMDKMSIDTSEAHTYDKNKSEDGEKCS